MSVMGCLQDDNKNEIEGSYFDVSDEVGLVESEQHFFTKHEIKSFMLNMRIG